MVQHVFVRCPPEEEKDDFLGWFGVIEVTDDEFESMQQSGMCEVLLHEGRNVTVHPDDVVFMHEA